MATPKYIISISSSRARWFYFRFGVRREQTTRDSFRLRRSRVSLVSFAVFAVHENDYARCRIRQRAANEFQKLSPTTVTSLVWLTGSLLQ